MDDGQGRFRLADTLDEIEQLKAEYTNHKGVFTVGEKIQLKGSHFKVKSIKPRTIVLKLLKHTIPFEPV